MERFSKQRRAWSPGRSPTSSPLSGSTGIWPEQNSRPRERTACEYGPTAAGAPRAVTTSRWWDMPAEYLLLVGSLSRHGQSPGERNLALPAPAPGQPGRLAALGPRGAGGGAPPGRAAGGFDRLLRVPLVPRDGARVLRGPGGRRLHERALCVREGGPRGAPGRRRDLRSEEHTSELQSRQYLVCRLLLEKK